MSEPPAEHDPFEGLTFDEDFVRGGRRELSADERATLARWQAEAAAARRSRERAERRARRQGRLRAPRFRTWRRSWLAVSLFVFLGLVAWNDWDGAASGGGAGSGWAGGPSFVLGVGDERPPLRESDSDEPLGVPPVVAGAGPHTFMATQPGSIEPVAFDPCRPIDVVINARTAPPIGAELLAEAIAEVSAATGLVIRVEGQSDEVPTSERGAYQRDRYGDRWAPVLVAWTDPATMPELEGVVAGIGGPVMSGVRGGPQVSVSGIVALDGPQLTEMLDWPGGAAQVRGVILHELGHLVGLGHVDDPSQLMHSEGHPGIDSFQQGDRAGLARLGQGACVDRL